MYDYLAKIILLGPSGAGKQVLSLLRDKLLLTSFL
jgi:ribose 1,5-bisphosphokinase PhnN